MEITYQQAALNTYYYNWKVIALVNEYKKIIGNRYSRNSVSLSNTGK